MNHSENGIKESHKIYFVVTTIIVFIILSSIFSYSKISDRFSSIEELRESERHIVNIADISLNKDLNVIISDLRYLQGAFKDDLISNTNYDVISRNWLEFSKQRKIYDQIRYISLNGDEKIRINKEQGDNCSIVSNEELQNKADRYYFKESIKLEDGDIYISPLDLNVENGVVETPYKPMIRLSIPVYNNDKLDGIIIINYLASELLKDLKEISMNSVGELSLLNSDGFFLLSEKPERDWGFMFNRDQDNFISDYPNTWMDIIDGKEEIINTKGYFFSHKILLSDLLETYDSKILVGEQYQWLVISVIPRNNVNSNYFYDDFFDLLLDIFIDRFLIFILMLIVSIIIGYLVFVNDRYHTRIKNYSRYDSLTSIYNRGYGMSLMNKDFASDDDRIFPISLCYLDINGLKEVNDNLGHSLGSQLIVSVTSTIMKTISKKDYVIRLGGDEIIIVFLSKTKEEAESIWKEILLKYEYVNKNENREYLISVSHGIHQFDFKDKSTPDVAINIVDELMYKEKQAIKKNLKTILK